MNRYRVYYRGVSVRIIAIDSDAAVAIAASRLGVLRRINHDFAVFCIERNLLTKTGRLRKTKG